MARQRPTSTELVRALQALVNAVNGRAGSVEQAMQRAETLLQRWRTGEPTTPQPEMTK